jgi:hypothetical protein
LREARWCPLSQRRTDCVTLITDRWITAISFSSDAA